MADSKEPKAGHVKVVLHNAGLTYSTQCCGSMDPYVQFTLGPTRHTSPVCASGHKAPNWPAKPKFFFEIGGNPKEKYEILHVEVKNKKFFCDQIIGQNDIPFSAIVSNVENTASNDPPASWLGKPQDIKVKAGELHASIFYVPPMVITLHEAKNLQDVQLIGKQDPYCILEMQGCIAPGSNGKFQSAEHNDGATAPKWHQKFQFNVLDRSELEHELNKPASTSTSVKEEKRQEPGLWIQVIDANVLIDKAIGYCFVSLAQLLEAKKNGQPQWFKLYKGTKELASKDDCGMISLSVG